MDRNRERESEKGREGNGRFREGKSQWEGAEIERVGGLGKGEKEGKKEDGRNVGREKKAWRVEKETVKELG